MPGCPWQSVINLFLGHSPLHNFRYLQLLHSEGKEVVLDWPNSSNFSEYTKDLRDDPLIFPILYWGNTKWSQVYMLPSESMTGQEPQWVANEHTPGSIPRWLAKTASNIWMNIFPMSFFLQISNRVIRNSPHASGLTDMFVIVPFSSTAASLPAEVKRSTMGVNWINSAPISLKN